MSHARPTLDMKGEPSLALVPPRIGIEGRQLAASRTPSLSRNVLWTVAGDGVYAACQWGLLIVIARLGTTEMLGQFVLGLAITAPVIMLTGLSLRAFQATDVRGHYWFGDYLALRLFTGLLSIVAILAIAAFGGYRRETAWIILAVGGAKVIEMVSDIFYGVLQRHERMQYISKSLLLKGPGSLAAMAVGIAATGEVLWGVVGLASVWIGILLFYDLPNGKRVLSATGQGARLRPRWRPGTLAGLARAAFPLGLSAMCISISASIPRLYLERCAGERELGIFAAAAYLMVVGGMVINAVGQAATPRLARHYADGDLGAFHLLLLKLVAVAAFLGAAGIALAWAFGQQGLMAIYGAEYAARPEILVWVMVAAAISYIGSCLGYGITATRAFGRFYLPYLGMAAITLLAAMAWVPASGVMGAAATLCVTAGMSCIAPVLIYRGVRMAS